MYFLSLGCGWLLLRRHFHKVIFYETPVELNNTRNLSSQPYHVSTLCCEIIIE